MRKLEPVALLALCAALLALPATADATLAFVRKPLKPQVWVADDDGGHAHRLLAGSNPRVSPDGKIVALLRQRSSPRAQPEMILAAADRGAPPSVLAKGWRDPYVFAWSPDSRTVAAVLGPELGEQRLVLIDAEDGSQLTVARGFFNGVGFDPRGEAIVYGRAASERFPPRSDVYRFDVPPPGAVFVRAPAPVRITRDNDSVAPLWTPRDEIVFARQLGAKKRRYVPKNELFRMDPAGGMVRQLTRSRVPPLAQGLFPTAVSANGRRLLAQFEGQDLTYAVSVNALSGAQRPLVEATEQGFVGTGMSADGRLVLGSTGGFEFGRATSVATVPYPHGRPRILARHAFEPSWNR